MGGRGASSGSFQAGQAAAIESYVSGEMMWINRYFRENGEGFGALTPDEKKFVQNLDEALDRRVESSILYRSVDSSAIFGNNVDYYNLMSAMQGFNDRYSLAALQGARRSLGKTIKEKGYLSTTRSARIAEEWGGFSGSSQPVVMRITTSANTKGRNVSNATKNLARIERNDPQKETLLARNQSYTVDKLYYKNGNIYVDVTMK